jgi:hypothetical protein
LLRLQLQLQLQLQCTAHASVLLPLNPSFMGRLCVMPIHSRARKGACLVQRNFCAAPMLGATGALVSHSAPDDPAPAKEAGGPARH